MIQAWEQDYDDKVRIGPGRLPLEVGYLTSERALLHLRQEAGYAHWPYQQDKIWLFKMTCSAWEKISREVGANLQYQPRPKLRQLSFQLSEQEGTGA